MSAIGTKAICSTIMAISGLIAVKKISDSKEKLLSIKNSALILFLILLPITIYHVDYTYVYTITVYITMTVVYKYIFKVSYLKSVIYCGLVISMLAIFDLINAALWISFVSLKQIRSIWYISILSNIITSSLLIITVSIRKIRKKLTIIVEKLEFKKVTKFFMFFFLIIISISIVLYSVSRNFKLNSLFTTNFLIILILFLLVLILISERNNYDKLFSKYDNLFNYVRVFEDWIENEQLIRHEYKNQLAVLRCMTKEKEVKEKIDSIISNNINIDGEMIGQLKNLPSGGFKGLLYYKIAVARNSKVNIDVDVGSDVAKRLKKFNKEELEILSKLIGIYCDNAIEAAKDTRKKIVLIEIYEYNKTVHIVISNTFNKKKDISRRYEKGVSTKGEGRGNGLYFANKLISKNKWIEEKQDIIDNFYIQKISVIKSKQKKNDK